MGSDSQNVLIWLKLTGMITIIANRLNFRGHARSKFSLRPDFQNVLIWLKFDKNDHDNIANGLNFLSRSSKVKGLVNLRSDFQNVLIWLKFDMNDHDNIDIDRLNLFSRSKVHSVVTATFNYICSEYWVIWTLFNFVYLILKEPILPSNFFFSII